MPTNKTNKTMKVNGNALSTFVTLDVTSIHNAALLAECAKLEPLETRIREAGEKYKEEAKVVGFEQAKILARIADTKQYEKDGFDSMKSFIESLGGLRLAAVSKSSLSQLCKAGRVYNDTEAPEVLKALPPFVLCELPTSDKDTRNEVYKDADVDAARFEGMTQKAARDYREDVKSRKPQTGKPVKVYQCYHDGALVCGEDTKPLTWPLKDFESVITEDAKKYGADLVKAGSNRFVFVFADHAELYALVEQKPQIGEVKKLDELAVLKVVIRKLMRGEDLSDKEAELADKYELR